MNKTKILLVDDRIENLITLEHILDNSKREFINASSGAEALMITECENIGLIMLDYQLDDMTGIEVAQQLRNKSNTAHIPIIFVTALSKNERKKLSQFEEGTVDFLFKPIDIEETNTKVAIFERIAMLQERLAEKEKITST
jgi:response regulator RpfG family c-di-GMP phosphodiesterase